MAEIKTVISTASESSVKFADFYQFAWIKNIGDTTAYVSNKSGISAGGADVAEVGAGDAVMIVTETDTIYVKGATTLECHAQNFAESPFLDVTVQSGEEPTLITKNITANGTYTASADNADGYSQVVVDVQEQPWSPLEDGYSNFWFELTDDTLSPWLNFSAKNNDAVIDWGDGSGEVALDTLTPTHTYTKAGRYVVKVKGVTGLDILYLNTMTNSAYMDILKNVELNSEVTSLVLYSFRRCIGLENVVISENANVGSYSFQFCGNLKTINYSEGANSTAGTATFYNCASLRYISLPSGITEIIQEAFYNCVSLQTITIPALVTNIGNNAFNGCATLTEIHVLPSAPPTLGTNVFGSISSSYVIYVPVGTLAAYQSAWSAYADHIVEEGGQLTRTQLRNIQNEAKKSDTGDDMR